MVRIDQCSTFFQIGGMDLHDSCSFATVNSAVFYLAAGKTVQQSTLSLGGPQ
jgi:hypothetical protein